MVRSGWSREVFALVRAGALIVGLTRCGPGEAELDSERSAWESVRPTRYRFDYTVTGFAPGGGPWNIEVNAEQVVSVAYAGPGATPEIGLNAETAPTIEDLFERVAQALDKGQSDVTVRYDPQWHHPVEAYFDGGEEGSGFKAERLTPVD